MNKKLIFIGVLSLFIVSSLTNYGQECRKKPSSAEAQIRAALESTAVGWNEGDLEKYLVVYTPDATEMRGTGPAGGVEAIEQTMRSGFWKTGRPPQTLRYESVVVRMLGKEGALATGNYILTGGNIPERKSWFTSVWRKTKNSWRMIHDHS